MIELVAAVERAEAAIEIELGLMTERHMGARIDEVLEELVQANFSGHVEGPKLTLVAAPLKIAIGLSDLELLFGRHRFQLAGEIGRDVGFIAGVAGVELLAVKGVELFATIERGEAGVDLRDRVSAAFIVKAHLVHIVNRLVHALFAALITLGSADEVELAIRIGDSLEGLRARLVLWERRRLGCLIVVLRRLGIVSAAREERYADKNERESFHSSISLVFT